MALTNLGRVVWIPSPSVANTNHGPFSPSYSASHSGIGRSYLPCHLSVSSLLLRSPTRPSRFLQPRIRLVTTLELVASESELNFLTSTSHSMALTPIVAEVTEPTPCVSLSRSPSVLEMKVLSVHVSLSDWREGRHLVDCLLPSLSSTTLL